MEALFRFLAEYELLIYLILGISLIVTFRWLWQAYFESRDAVYGLEQQVAIRHLTTAIGSIILIIMLATGELFITSFVVPTLPAATFLQTPTVYLLPPVQSTPGTESSTLVVGTIVPSGIAGSDTTSNIGSKPNHN